MSIDHLEKLFSPRSVAVIGATPREGAIGRAVMEQLLTGGFDGPVWPVNPKHQTLMELTVHPGVGALPEAPDLAVIATPARTIPEIVEQLGTLGCRAAIVLSGGLEPDTPGRSAMLQAAAAHGMRIVGPDCIGVIRPGRKLNA
ncbi:MAG: CoA-binding protein, partial [Pseudomonadota bacterium]